MDLTTLNNDFLANRVVDEFISAIWTERYSESGDAQIVLAATPRNINMLAEGTFLACRGSKAICQIETQEISEGILTVTGPMLEAAILEQRWVWPYNSHPEEDPTRFISDYESTTRTPGEVVSNLVHRFVSNPTAYPEHLAQLDWEAEEIEELSLGDIDTSGSAEKITAAVGPVYDAVQRVAKEHGVGISLYLESADPIDGFSLKFKTYRGVDRTSDQEINPLIRLSPDEDSLSDVKEIRSRAKYKNICYVYYRNQVTKHFAEPDLPEPLGLDRRVLVTDAEGDPVGRKVPAQTVRTSGWYSQYVYHPGTETFIPEHTVVDYDELLAFRVQNARDALANHNYIRAVDGETSPISEYVFGVDYGLGDLIELEGLSGTISKARITEYIRSQDKSGERSYPTISVLSQEGGEA